MVLDIDMSKVTPTSQRQMQSQYSPRDILPFGKEHSEHFFMMRFSEGKWHSPIILPYANGLNISPDASGTAYGAAIFEGGKAFQHENGEIYLFRPDENAKRLNHSADVICMPNISVEDQLQAMSTLIDTDRLWYPNQDGASLYIRPKMFEVDDKTKLGIGDEYVFTITLRPSGAYYSQGFSPGQLLVTDRFHRALPGGTGSAKFAGNYAAVRGAEKFAQQFGAQQVLYLDLANKFLEEAGAMNHFHVNKDGVVVIPEFRDTILKSITSMSMLALEDRLGHPVRQERIPIGTFMEGIRSGEIKEAGGFGTAAGVAPIGSYLIDLKTKKEISKVRREDLGNLVVWNGGVGPVTRGMYDLLTGIQRGTLEAPEGWMYHIDRTA